MKKIINSILVGSLLLGGTSCSKDFLNQSPETAVDSSKSIKSLVDLEASITGLYSGLRGTSSFGRHNVVIPEVCSDNANILGATGNHYIQIEQFSYTDGADEIADVWLKNYYTIRNAVMSIKGGKELLKLTSWTPAEVKQINDALAQAYAVKALCHFTLANYFCEGYLSDANALSKKGIPLVGDDYLPNDIKPVRGTLKGTYDHIINELDSALNYATFANSGDYFSLNGFLGLKARVLLSKRDYAGAEAAAKEAIEFSEGMYGLALAEGVDLAGQFATNLPTTEDMFILTVNKAESSGTNSLWNMFASQGELGTNGYGCRLSIPAYTKYAATDVRKAAWYLPCPTARDNGKGTRKYYGAGSYLAKSIVMRLSEMYLIVAEAMNEQNLDGSDFLFAVAKRNTAITSAQVLKTTYCTSQEATRNFIRDERVRELALEGHRLWDLKRTGEVTSRTTPQFRSAYKNWNATSFVFPIPKAEVNATKIEHDADWDARKPPRS